jgi:hypothetical protein
LLEIAEEEEEEDLDQEQGILEIIIDYQEIEVFSLKVSL